MKVIDMHTHIFPDGLARDAVSRLVQVGGTPPHADGTAAGLLRSMLDCGVDISVVQPVATKPGQVRSINAFAAQVNGRSGILAFGGIHPACEDWREALGQAKSLGLYGVKLHPDYQRTFIDDARYVRIIKECGRLKLMVLTHSGIDIGYPETQYCTPERIAAILPEIGDTVFICAHYGGHGYFEDAVKYLAGTGVYIDTAYSQVEYGEAPCRRVLEAFDEDHILFGSDSPWTDQRESAAFIQGLGFPPEKTGKILWGNAARLLGLR